ncbi:MAG TPA: cellulase family glycosylhydrolase [Cyclobacteriaceae bacterium]|nr:cellulase family glycosylhydrolase [Cyclobacteriaceae bacterium]
MKITVLTASFCLFCFAGLIAFFPSGGGYGIDSRGSKIHASQNLNDDAFRIAGREESPADVKFGTPGQVCAGVNIHFVTGHEKDLDMIVAAGFRFIRMDLEWFHTERKRGEYDWTDYDELTANLEERGLRALYILGYSNGIYEEVVSSKVINGIEWKSLASPQHSESVAAFAKWAAAAADHFKGKDIIWEIWNEPNIFYWQPRPDVEQYNALALATCKAIKAVVPDALIVGPSTSQVPLPFLESFLASGIMEYLDAVSVHPYRYYSKPPETANWEYEDLRKLIEQYAPEGKKEMPVISSEWGYPSHTNGVPLGQQAEFIVRMQLSNLLNGIPMSVWYDWKNDGDDPEEREHNFGTVTSDLNPKPAYTAIQTLNMQLKGYTLQRRLDLENENDYLLIFRNNKDKFKICAWTMDQAHSVTLANKIPKATLASATDGTGKSLKLKIDNEKLILDLTQMPQYIYLPRGIGD